MLEFIVKYVLEYHAKLTDYLLKPITTHGLRHTHRSLFFEGVISLQEVPVGLAHKGANITLQIYTHVTQEARTGAIQKFEHYMNA